jgi:Protein of unknown function (DUF3108)
MPCSKRNRPALRLLLFLLCAEAVQPQPTLPGKETLQYSVEWRLINAGKVQLGWSANTQADKAGWQAKVHIESMGLVSKMFKVTDDYSSLLNENLCVESSLMNSLEGKRHRETRVTFDGASKKASYREKDLNTNNTMSSDEIDIPSCVHDVFGGLYLLRTKQLEPGQSIQVAISDGKKSVSAKVEAQARETVKTPSGTYKTIRYEAYLFNNVLYRRPAHLYFWLTDDARKLPVQVRVKMQFTIGTITLQLEKES